MDTRQMLKLKAVIEKAEAQREAGRKRYRVLKAEIDKIGLTDAEKSRAMLKVYGILGGDA